MGAITTIPEQASSSVSEFATTGQLHLDSLKAHLSTAQNRMKLQADKHRVDRQFTVGDQVLLKLQPYAQSSVVNHPFPKLAFKYFGPYQVLERLGPAAYRLALPEGSLVHPVFHISQLKPFTPNYTPVYTQLPLLADLSATELEPESVLDRRLVKKGNRAIPQVLVKWANIPQASATWEDLYVVMRRFPTCLAWGQASSAAGGDVTPPAWRIQKTEDVFISVCMSHLRVVVWAHVGSE